MILDLIGQFFWILMFIMPLVTVLIVWKMREMNKILLVIIGVLVGSFFSVICYFISLAILFRNGMGN
jgi:CHASE2 domain-containing sensor protein